MEQHGYHRGLKLIPLFKNDINKVKCQRLLVLFFLVFIIFSFLISSVKSSSTLYSGTFNLYLNQNGSVGSQLLEYYVAIQYLNVTAINTTASINGRITNDLYLSRIWFITNTDGKMKILTNLNETQNYIIKVSINKQESSMANQSVFSFLNGDKIRVSFEVSNPMITKVHLNAIIGIIGIGLFCANPIISYILSNKAKDKFHFFFILISIGIVSVGLALTFIYG